MNACNHEFERSHTTEDYVVWICAKCKEQELEHFSELDDDGWAWVRNSFKKANR